MQLNKPVSYLLDFDSTFIRSEGLDELAAISLERNPDRKMILSEIQHLTKAGMEGKMPFEESLKKRIDLLKTNKHFIYEAAKHLKKNISPSILRNKQFFQQRKDNIYIISGGFKELILPVVAEFDISPKHVFANSFLYDSQNNVIGIDEKNVMSKNQGKVKVVTSLKFLNDVYIIGDGYTDYELKKLGLADKFIAFTENIERDIVTKHADEVAPNFDEFLFENKLPSSLSYPKNRISVSIQTKIPHEDLLAFEREGYKINIEKDNFEATNTTILCTDKDSFTKLKKPLMGLAIGLYGSHDDHDLQDATERGIAVYDKKNIAQKIISYVNTGSTSRSLNMPDLSLKQYSHSHRLLHIHKNVPGILSQINQIMTDHKSNILGQYLKTNNDIGYVIIDIDKQYDHKVLSLLKKIPHTIRFRILY